MTKIIALTAVGMFAVASAFAGSKGDCTKQVGNEAKAPCQVSFASLNLTADQKTKLEAAKAEHEKAGCSEASEAKYMEQAKGILTKEQFTKFEAECSHMKEAKDKTQT